MTLEMLMIKKNVDTQAYDVFSLTIIIIEYVNLI